LQDLHSFPTRRSSDLAMMNYPETMSNMVRVGIMQYGYWSNKETLIRYSDQVTEDSILDTSKALSRLLEWKTTVMSVKKVEKGERSEEHTSELQSRENL